MEHRCVYMFKGITERDSLLSATPVGAKQSILKPHIQDLNGFSFFPISGYCLLTFAPTSRAAVRSVSGFCLPLG